MTQHADQCNIPGHTHNHAPIRIGRNLFIWGSLFLVALAASNLPGLEQFHIALVDFLRLTWWAILLGLVLGGLIEHFVPRGFILRYLGGGNVSSLGWAVVAGFLMSACSHGMLAIAIQLYKKGAGIPAVVTFLLASPWANLPVTILLFSFFGIGAFYFIGGAMLIAFITGLIYMQLERLGWIEQSETAAISDTYEWTAIRQFDLGDALHGTWAGTVRLANMVLWWILIGILIGAALGAFVPHDILAAAFAPTVVGLLLTLAVATVIEVCSEGSAPIAFEVFKQAGGALGNPFVFLMAGVATDYTEIGLLWTNVGRRTAIWLPIVTVPQVLLLGYVFNQFL